MLLHCIHICFPFDDFEESRSNFEEFSGNPFRQHFIVFDCMNGVRFSHGDPANTNRRHAFRTEQGV